MDFTLQRYNLSFCQRKLFSKFILITLFYVLKKIEIRTSKD